MLCSAILHHDTDILHAKQIQMRLIKQRMFTYLCHKKITNREFIWMSSCKSVEYPLTSDAEQGKIKSDLRKQMLYKIMACVDQLHFYIMAYHCKFALVKMYNVYHHRDVDSRKDN